MKKYISIILAVLMAFSLAACKDKEDSPTIDSGNSQSAQSGDVSQSKTAQFRGKLIEPTMKVIASGNYMYEIKSAEDPDPITYATTGDKSLMTYTTDGVPLTFLTKGGKFYIVSATDNAYGEITPAVASQYNIELKSLTALFKISDLKDFLDCSYKGPGNEDVNGQTCKYEDYYDPLNQTTRRFYFDNSGNLAYMTTMNANGEKGVVSSIFIYSASNSAFDKINSYAVVDMENGTAQEPVNNASK